MKKKLLPLLFTLGAISGAPTMLEAAEYDRPTFKKWTFDAVGGALSWNLINHQINEMFNPLWGLLFPSEDPYEAKFDQIIEELGKIDAKVDKMLDLQDIQFNYMRDAFGKMYTQMAKLTSRDDKYAFLTLINTSEVYMGSTYTEFKDKSIDYLYKQSQFDNYFDFMKSLDKSTREKFSISFGGKGQPAPMSEKGVASKPTPGNLDQMHNQLDKALSENSSLIESLKDLSESYSEQQNFDFSDYIQYKVELKKLETQAMAALEAFYKLSSVALALYYVDPDYSSGFSISKITTIEYSRDDSFEHRRALFEKNLDELNGLVQSYYKERIMPYFQGNLDKENKFKRAKLDIFGTPAEFVAGILNNKTPGTKEYYNSINTTNILSESFKNGELEITGFTFTKKESKRYIGVLEIANPSANKKLPLEFPYTIGIDKKFVTDAFPITNIRMNKADSKIVMDIDFKSEETKGYLYSNIDNIDNYIGIYKAIDDTRQYDNNQICFEFSNIIDNSTANPLEISCKTPRSDGTSYFYEEYNMGTETEKYLLQNSPVLTTEGHLVNLYSRLQRDRYLSKDWEIAQKYNTYTGIDILNGHYLATKPVMNYYGSGISIKYDDDTSKPSKVSIDFISNNYGTIHEKITSTSTKNLQLFGGDAELSLSQDFTIGFFENNVPILTSENGNYSLVFMEGLEYNNQPYRMLYIINNQTKQKEYLFRWNHYEGIYLDTHPLLKINAFSVQDGKFQIKRTDKYIWDFTDYYTTKYEQAPKTNIHWNNSAKLKLTDEGNLELIQPKYDEDGENDGEYNLKINV